MKKLFTLILLMMGFIGTASAAGSEGRRIYVKIVDNSWHDAWGQGGLCLHVWGNDGDLTGGWNNCIMTRLGSSDWACIQTNELPASVSVIAFCKNAESWRKEVDGIDLRNKYIELGSTITIQNLDYSVLDATNKTVLGTMTTNDNLTYTYDVDATSSNIQVLIAPSFASEFGFEDTSELWHQCFRPYGNESSGGFGFENKTGQHFGIWNNSSDSWALNARANYTFTFAPNALENMSISPYVERTLPSAAEGYATFSSEYNVIPQSGLIAKYASGINTTTKQITWVDFESTGIKAGEGALLKGTAGNTYKFTPATEPVDHNTGNLMKAISTNTTLTGNKYILSKVGDLVAFYKVNSDGGSKVNAGTAYLEVPSAGARDFFTLDGDATAIESIKQEAEIDGEYYNLAGQRVAQPTKGLYIVNGKKVMMK